MGGVFPDRGNLSLPASLVQEYQWTMDAFIDDTNIGHICSLVYPPRLEECPNCFLDAKTGRSINIYKSGGPAAFPNHTTCPWCNGEGRLRVPVEETIRLRVYYNPKDFIPGLPVEAKDAVVQVIGYLTDLPKLERATEVILDSNLQPLQRIKCVRSGAAAPWGFGQRYFAQLLRVVK